MRVTTNQLYTQSVNRILDLQASTRDATNQISSGKRINRPGDDPVAAAEIMQIRDHTNGAAQFDRNGVQAESRLTQVDDVLGGVSNMLQRVHDLVLQGRSESISNADRDSIAKEIREQMEVLVDLGNTRNASGEYIFAGAAVGTRPFTSDALGNVSYNGDQTVRELQLSETRTIAESFTGHDALFAVRNGNGTFIGGRVATNTGTGQISDNTVLNGAAYVAHDFRISFTSATSFDIIDDTLGSNVATGQAYTDGAAISFNGSQVTVFGAANTGDQFTIKPSQNQSMFKTLGNIAGAFEKGYANPAEQANFGFDIDRTIEALDRSMEKVGELRSTTGARLNSITSQRDVNDQVNLNLQTLRSKLEDVDLAKAITELSQQSSALQAAQQAFVKVQGLSLFNYL